MTAVERLQPRGEPLAVRIPPHSHEAEMFCIGHCMRGAFDDIADVLRPEHFTDPGHRRIYEACQTLAGQGRRIDPISVTAAVRDDAEVRRLGGAEYVTGIAASSFGGPWARQHAGILIEAWTRRGAIAIAERIVAQSYEPADDPETGEPVSGAQIVADAERDLMALEDRGDTERGPVSLKGPLDEAVQIADAAQKSGTGITGIPSGLIDLDKTTGGFHPTDLIVIAGRPGMGKSALAQRIARGAARAGHGVLFFALEMGATQLAQREFAAELGISTERQRSGQISVAEIEDMVMAQQRIEALPLWIDDTPANSVAKLHSRARRFVRRHKVALVVVDYLQLILGKGRPENRTSEVTQITRDLKVMAKDLAVPVIALSQLSREVEKRDDHRPQLADLRDSGSIEQDADVVMFVFREEYYIARAEPQERDGEDAEKFQAKRNRWYQRLTAARNKADLHVSKNRHGPERKIALYFDGERATFESWSEDR